MKNKPAMSLLAATLGFFTITLDALIVSVALPAIGDSMKGSMIWLQWVLDGYTLPFAALLLFAGSLSDRFGAKKVYAVGVTLFSLSSAACGAAFGIQSLVLARFLQGVGAAMMTPASLSLIGEAYTDATAKARAIGFWAAGGAVASATSPLLGGLLTFINWRLIFLVNFPIGLVILFVLTKISPSRKGRTPFDLSGQVISFICLASFIYGLIQMGETNLRRIQVLVPLGLALVTGLVFFFIEAVKKHPMLPLGLFRSRVVSTTVAIGFTFMMGFFGMVFVVSFYLQLYRGLSVLQTGLAFVPVTAFSIFIPIVAARMGEWFGVGVPIILGQVCMFTGLFLLSLFGRYVSVPVLILFMIPVGIGAGMAMPSATSLLLNSVSPAISGTASGVLNTSRQVGGALGIAIFGALISAEGYERGLRISLFIGGAMLLMSAGASFHLFRQRLFSGDSREVCFQEQAG